MGLAINLRKEGIRTSSLMVGVSDHYTNRNPGGEQVVGEPSVVGWRSLISRIPTGPMTTDIPVESDELAKV